MVGPLVDRSDRADNFAGSGGGVLVPEYVDDGVPMLRINDIENGLASRDDLKKISTQLSDEYSRTLLEEGDIALAVVGTIGRSLIVDK
jgi:type I restriction enzyme S subunit